MGEAAVPDSSESPFGLILRRFSDAALWKQLLALLAMVVIFLFVECGALFLAHKMFPTAKLETTIFGVTLSADFEDAKPIAGAAHIETHGAGSPVLDNSKIGRDLNIKQTSPDKQ